MGKPSSRPSPTTSTVVNSTSIPSWLEGPMQNNLQMANDIAARPFAYPEQTLAGLNPNVQQAWDYGRSTINNQAGTFDAAKSMAAAGGAAPERIGAETFRNGLSGISQYMNPYNQQVVDVARQNMGVALQQNLNTIGDRAIQQGAFGGSRQGVAEGVATSEASRQLADLSANLQTRGFDNATQMMGQDITNNLSAQRANQQAGLDASRTSVAGSIALGGLGQQSQQSQLQDMTTLMNVGTGQQSWNQQQIDDAVSRWSAERAYPVDQLNLRMGAITSTPIPRSSTSTSTGYQGGSSNMGMSALGGAMTGAQLGSSLFGGSTAAGVGGSLLGGLLGIFSDENEKEDIQKVGKLPNGLNAYAFRYKGDPKSYPKVVGVMAQEVQKKDPKAVTKIGNRLVVNGLRGAA